MSEDKTLRAIEQNVSKQQPSSLVEHGYATIPHNYALNSGRTEGEVKNLINSGANKLWDSREQLSRTLVDNANEHLSKPKDYSNELLVFSFAENLDSIKAKVRSTSQEASYLSNIIITQEYSERYHWMHSIDVSDSSPTVEKFQNKLVVIKSRQTNVDLMDEKRWLILPKASCDGNQITLELWGSTRFLRLL
jgi:hypothetical protein